MPDEIKVPVPVPRRSFKINGEDVEIFMSFQRLNSLLRVLETPDRLVSIAVDPDLSEGCMCVLLAKKQREQFEVDLEDYGIEEEVYDQMILWCRDHVTHFFTKRLKEAVAENEALRPLVTGLQSSLVGLVP